MSAREVLLAAVCGALGEVVEPLGLTVFPYLPERVPPRFVVVEAPVLADWSTKSWLGVEGRLAVVVHDQAERPDMVHGLLELAEDTVAAIPAPLAGGWRLVAQYPVRSRVARAGAGSGGGAGRWRGTAEFLVRMVREDG